MISYWYTYERNRHETGNDYYGARYYDPKISVWLSVDPLAHKYPSLWPYVFTGNNPIMLVDPDGRQFIDFYNLKGKKIGTDGNQNDNRSFVVTDRKEARAIKRAGGTTQLGEVSSARLSPSKRLLQAALNDFNATEREGGSRESVTVLLNDGRSVSNLGPEAVQNNNSVEAHAGLPALPEGYTPEDISHSHITKTYFTEEGIEFSGGNALVPSEADLDGAFSFGSFNIITGPRGKGKYFDNADGTKTFFPSSNGIAVYPNGQSKPSFTMSIDAVKEMISTMQ